MGMLLIIYKLSPTREILYFQFDKEMSHSFNSKLWLICLWLFFFAFGIRHTDGHVCIAVFLFETAAEVVVAAVDGASAAFALNIIVTVLGFNFITTDIATDGVFNNHR